MISTETNLPDDWSPGEWTAKGEWDTSKAKKNVKWVAKLGSESYGNVTVAGGKVFVGTKQCFAAQSERHRRPRRNDVL